MQTDIVLQIDVVFHLMLQRYIGFYHSEELEALLDGTGVTVGMGWRSHWKEIDFY